MSIIAKSNGDKEFAKLPLPEAGTTQAVCCAVWDLGLQRSNFLNEDGTPKVQRKVIIAWEISEKINAPDSEFHGKPYMLNKKYTLSLNEKANLRRDLESWRGKAFTAEELENGIDMEKLYGVNCFLGVKHENGTQDTSKVFANVSSILPLPKGMEAMKPVRARDEAAPKWVIEKQQQAIAPDDVPQPSANPFGPADDESFPY